jgi:hypothetical protein
MTRIQARRPQWLRFLLVLLLCAGVAGGCAKPQAPTAPPPPAVDPCAGYAQLQKQHGALQKLVARQRATLKATEAELSRVQLQLLEEGARSVASEKRLQAQEKMLDEAVQEVVRAKSKLRTIESRAEAASTMAETEIAVKAMQESLAADSGGHLENMQRAEELLKMSAREFKGQNYAGALYLAGQARSQINTIQINPAPGDAGAIQPGEISFSQPLPLKIIKRCNFRRTPDLEGLVIEVLETGTLIVGFAHKDTWIRVATEGGRSGWVYQSLVGVR